MAGFQRASRKRSKLRLALVGPSGSGKTYTALAIAKGLDVDGNGIAVLDTEHGSASLYAGEVADFDVKELEDHSPETYCKWIEEAGREGYAVLVIDSLSHAWAGKGGVLEFVDERAKRERNNFAAWRDATPKHNRLVEAILASPCHVVATMRSKTEYVLEEQTRAGKRVQVPTKVGMQPVQRDGVEYEFTIVGDMTLNNELVVGKTRYSALAGKVIDKPGVDLARDLLAWLDSGAEAPRPTQPQKAPASTNAILGARAADAIDEAGTEDDVQNVIDGVVDKAPPARLLDVLEVYAEIRKGQIRGDDVDLGDAADDAREAVRKMREAYNG